MTPAEQVTAYRAKRTLLDGDLMRATTRWLALPDRSGSAGWALVSEMHAVRSHIIDCDLQIKAAQQSLAGVQS